MCLRLDENDSSVTQVLDVEFTQHLNIDWYCLIHKIQVLEVVLTVNCTGRMKNVRQVILSLENDFMAPSKHRVKLFSSGHLF